MLYLIGYDVSTSEPAGRKRLSKVAKICCNYGQRVQNSLFECDLNGAQFVAVKAELLENINEKADSLRIYNLGNNYSRNV